MKQSEFQETIAKHQRMSAALHPSRKWKPLVHYATLPDMDTGQRKTPDNMAECWKNDIYEITVRRYPDGWPLGKGPWVYLGIASHDGAARHDWRDMQRIKNEICGPEWEAIELFPAESRLIDPSNYYLLWCAPAIAVGRFCERQVASPANCIAPQRGWAPGDEPADSGAFLKKSHATR